jgi:hypothetical protein
VFVPGKPYQLTNRDAVFSNPWANPISISILGESLSHSFGTVATPFKPRDNAIRISMPKIG